MKKSILLVEIIVASMFLVGCGGGAPAGITPPEQKTPTPTPTPTIPDPQKETSYWETKEYKNTGAYEQINLSSAYVQGYTGAGVKVGIIDSGVSYDSEDLEKNLVESVSTFNYKYNPSTGKYTKTANLLTKDQVEKISLLTGGTGYKTAPKITITGDGHGAKAVAIVKNGVVTEIRMTDFGTNYSKVDVSIDNNNTQGSGLTLKNVYFGGEDDIGHGSATAGLIAAEKNQLTVSDPLNSKFIQGVAFNSKIYTAKIFNSVTGGTISQLLDGFDWMNKKHVDVVNLSMGTTSSFSLTGTSMETLLKNGTSIVVAAGNNGLDCKPTLNGDLNGRCSFPAALPYKDTWILNKNISGGWLVVGSVNSSNVLSSFSNKAGVMKDYYVVAPGEKLVSTTLKNHYSYNTGTSFSTPLVTGTMALLKEKYPHLTGKDLTSIILTTATDLGAPGVDDVYGHGLLNIKAAFAPIGGLGISNTTNINNHNTTNINKSKLVLSSAFGNVLMKTQSLENVVAFDSYQRDFPVDMTQAIHSSKSNFSFNQFQNIINDKHFSLGIDKYNHVKLGLHNKNDHLFFSYTNDLLGSKGQGSFNLGNSKSYYLGYNKGMKINDTIVYFKLNYGYGKTNINHNQSLINSISNLQALGGNLTFQYNNLGFKYSIPLHIISGKTNLNIPVGRELDGTVDYKKYSQSLKVKDFEQKYTFFLKKHISKNTNLFSSLDLIQNENNIKSSQLTNNIHLNFETRF